MCVHEYHQLCECQVDGAKERVSPANAHLSYNLHRSSETIKWSYLLCFCSHIMAHDTGFRSMDIGGAKSCQKEQLMKMQDEVGCYTEMTSH